MNFQLSPELESLITTLFAENKCACHVLNPHKTRILMWKEVRDHQTTYYLRIGIQKFSSQEQIDRNGELYWRYYAQEPKKEVNQEEPTKPELDPITKFQQRQAQAINHDAANPTEPAVTNS